MDYWAPNMVFCCVFIFGAFGLCIRTMMRAEDKKKKG